jgi:dextranase
MEKRMVRSAKILSVQFDKAFYQPGEAVRLAIQVTSEVNETSPARLTALISHLLETTGRSQLNILLAGGEQEFELVYTPPPSAPRGYGVNVKLESDHGEALATAFTSFDVLEHWTQTPRYGFLSDFTPGRKDAAETLQTLTRYHINGLQFYDWMYRHEQLLANEDPYLDLLGRRLSFQTVDDLIEAAHRQGMAAMPYTAVYGASIAFYQEHPDWALFNQGGKPALFGENFMAIMDPRPGSPWSAHLLNQFDQVLENTAFDGIHLDQYGDPKAGCDSHGNCFELAGPLAEFINETKALVTAHRQHGTVVFNAVTNWPVETVAPARQDLVYIEVWPPYDWFNDLHSLIRDAQVLGGGKPVVLAAYMDPVHEHNVRLVDAIIFASGGSHIELGERADMLADPYFPNYKSMSPTLAEAVRRLYDFAVRYQDVIGPRARDATRDFQQRIIVEGVSTAPNAMKDKVWPIVREGEGFTAISLVNLLGLESADWKVSIKDAPVPLGRTAVLIKDVGRPAARVWSASPDGEDPTPRVLEFNQENGNLTFEFPSLSYWNLVVIEWRE